MRFGTSINQELTDRAQSRARGAYHIVPREQLERAGIQLGADMRVVEYKLPAGLFVQHPWLGAGAQPLQIKTVRVPQQVTEDGELVSTHILQLLGKLKPGPVHAVETMNIMQKLHRAMQMEVGKSLKNVSPYRAGERLLSAFQPVQGLGLALEQAQATNMSFGTSLSMALPQELFLPREHSKLFLPYSGKLPSYLRSFAYVQRMETGLGIRQSRLYGAEIIEAQMQNDADGDRKTVLQMRLLDAWDREHAKWYHIPEYPGTLFSGPRMDAGKWFDRKAGGLRGVAQDLGLLQGVDFLRGQNPMRVAGLMWKSYRKQASAQSREAVDTAVRKSLREMGSAIGQTTNALEALQHTQGLTMLKLLPEAERAWIMEDRSRLTLFMAHAQILREEGGPTGARQMLESVIQAQKKGRVEMEAQMKNLTLGFRRDVQLLWSQKHLLQKSQGEISELIAHLMAGGNLRDALYAMRTGMIPGSLVDAGRYAHSRPAPKPVQWTGPSQDGQRAAQYLRDTGLFDVRNLGRRVDQMPQAQVLIVRDPTTGEMVPIFGREVMNEAGDLVSHGLLMSPVASQQETYTPWTALSRELAADQGFMQALTVQDQLAEGGQRFVGELRGRWDYRELMKGDNEAVSKVRRLARVLNMTEDQVWGILRQGPSQAGVLLRRYELIEDGGRRWQGIVQSVKQATTNLGVQEIRFQEVGGMPVYPAGVQEYASRALLTDSGWLQGEEEQAAAHAEILMQRGLANPYKARGGGRFMATIARQGLLDSVNTDRLQVSMTQGLNSDWRTVKNALVQLDSKAYEDLAWEMARWWHTTEGVPIDSEEVIRQRVREKFTGQAEGSSIKGLELMGQESGFTSAHTVEEWAKRNKRWLSIDELAESAGITKQVSSTQKIARLFSNLRFELRHADGAVEHIDNLVPLENPVARGTMPEVLERIVAGRPTAANRRMLEEMRQLAVQGSEQPTEQHLGQLLTLAQKLVENVTDKSSQLWAVAVGEGEHAPDFSIQLAHRAGRIPVWEELEGQTLNSSELGGGELKVLQPGDPHWGITHTGSIRGLLAEGTEQEQYMAEKIAHFSGLPLEEVRARIRSGGESAIRDFAQNSDTVFDQTAEGLVDFVQYLENITGLHTAADREKIAQRTEANLLQGADEALLASGSLSRLPGSMAAEVLNGAANVAETVFGRGSRAGQVLTEIGESIVRQFLR